MYFPFNIWQTVRFLTYKAINKVAGWIISEPTDIRL